MNEEVNSNSKDRETVRAPELLETTSPNGMDLRPEPEQAVKISKKVGMVVVALAVILFGVLAYNGVNRRKQRAAEALSPQRKVEPARPDDVQLGLPRNVVPATRPNPGMRGASTEDSAELTAPPATLPNERVVVRSAPVQKPNANVAVVHPVREATPEERALALAYASEQQARLAPTGIRSAPSFGFGERNSAPATPNELPVSIQALARNLGQDGSRAGAQANQTNGGRSEYDEQNLQGQKEGFLDKARLGNVTEDYLKFTRTPPISRFEIKAGWEVPAVLEQALNSDLPGEVKALVMSNVYDTASGLYLLIPQGSRLVGSYNSRVSYGQNGLQVAWTRIIFPDASAIDLNGMAGLDRQGNSGLRDKVDRHYKQLFGIAVLTSMFDAALAVTQNRQQSVLVYPSATQEAESAVGREVSQLGTQITRKNLNVQPTVKIPVGYKFNVRVNRDILFEQPYQPITAEQNGPSERVARERSTR